MSAQSTTERPWTDAQKMAIYTRDKTLLVSAAAGSGKTAVLTKRITELLTARSDPADIGKMLIVTFTRAAATEMKDRIFEALTNELAKNPSDPHLNDQLMKLGSAQISTIDAFYMNIVRSNFSHLGISPNFRICDPAEDALLSNEVMTDAVDRCYETEPLFPRLVECFGGARSSDNVNDILIQLYSECTNIPEGIEFLRNYAQALDTACEGDLFATEAGRVLRDSTADFARHAIKGLTEALEYVSSVKEYSAPYFDTFDKMLSFSKSFLELLEKPDGGYTDARKLLDNYTLPPMGRLKKGEEPSEELARHKTFRTAVHKKYLDIRAKVFAPSPETVSRVMKETAGYTMILYKLLSDFEAHMEDEKKRRNYMTFSDVRRCALRLLVNPDGTPTATAKSYSQRYSDIFIDEYQDVDDVQDLIFSSIARPDNRFMVGDIKQSIYGFRGAQPKLFADYKSRFPSSTTSEAQDGSEMSIFMSTNFRCDRSIIEITNTVCSFLFSHCAESIGYTPEDDLQWGKPTAENYVSPKVHIDVIIPKTKPRLEKEKGELSKEELGSILTPAQYEAKFVAARIRELIDKETKADGKPILPGDIAIIVRRHSSEPVIVEALEQVGIKTSVNDKDRYFDDPDVMMMLCLLNAIDNPQRDVYLAGALRSPIFGFSLEDLITLRKCESLSRSLYDAVVKYASEYTDELATKAKGFIARLDSWRDSAASMPAHRLLRMILDCTEVISAGLETQQDSHGNGGNLLLLYEYARKFENGSFKGLSSFIDFINTMMEEGKKIEAPETPRSPDRVSLITSHHSKGLEFPVCFLFGCGRNLRGTENKESLVFDHTAGLALKLSDSTGFATMDTPLRKAILEKHLRDDLEEEMRILYVAMTRAKERLYITAKGTSEDSMLRKATENALMPSRYTLISCNSYIEWILTALAATPRKEEYYELTFHDAAEDNFDYKPLTSEDAPISKDDSLSENEKTFEEENADQANTPVAYDEELLDMLRKKYAFEYPYRELRRIPAKLTVSKLSPDILDENDNSARISHEKKAIVPDFFREDKGLSAQRVSAADRGTATHLFLQFCDVEGIQRHGIREELCRLRDKRFLPEDAHELIRLDELEAFAKSELFEQIINARRVIREQRFDLLLPAEEFTQNQKLGQKIHGERLAVQGVIDLVLIDAEGRLCLYDYKTDRLTKEELTDADAAKTRMNNTHANQLSYYKKAVELIFDRPCDRVAVYSTHAGRLIDIDPVPLVYPTET